MNRAMIEALTKDVRLAQRALDTYLGTEFPKGSRVGVLLQHGQVNLTWGTVESIFDGMIQVRIDSAKERSRRPYRLVQPKDVIEVNKEQSNVQ